VLTDARSDELCEGMRAADDDPPALVAHARMQQLVARKPKP